MRVVRYHHHGPARDVLRLLDAPEPEPGPGEVRVAVRASGVNPHDVKKRSGWLGGELPPAGVTPHSDGAGVIDAVGPGVAEARIGQRVYVLRAPVHRGTAAEKVVIGADWALPLPEDFSFAEGASLGVPAFTAWLAALADGPVTGRTVLVQGGGGCVGRVCVELAAWSGARVIATAGSEAGRAAAAARGADLVLDRNRDDVAAAVLDATGGRGADRIIEVDFAANQATDVAALADHGVVASYSSTSDKRPVLDYYGFALKGASVRFIQGAKLTPAQRDAAALVVGALAARGRLRPDVPARFPLAEIAAAHEAVEAGASGNVVVLIGDDA
ncbi:NADPH:quinone reductase [Rubrimonas sp.]|uniref:NADPH:quinone reductase n=1 Tax=Rubrimonas sp. TaxID=2036015 RepID=UPI002FDEF5C2